MKRPALAALACALALSACSVKTVAVRATAAVVSDGTPALREEPDPLFARDALPGQLKLLEGLLRDAPKDPRLLSALSEGFVGYAFMFLEDEQPDRARDMYRRALGYALRLAALNGDLAAIAVARPDALDAALARARLQDVPGLYWAAYAWAGWANLAKGDPEALAGMSRAQSVMRRVLALDPGFQFGGPDIFFGIYYCALPKMAGGDPDKGKAHFEAALARSKGKFLMAKVLYARYYAVAALDEALFRRLNEEVLAASGEDLPQARLTNEVAKLKAKKLLEKTNELF
ncbi:MAG TPA: TRAP transporter TatT component family protein [Elusimicrobiota bacterium]|nr:TRAP transporter TatT component family protein [Elusimicrobiota bacterium]